MLNDQLYTDSNVANQLPINYANMVVPKDEEKDEYFSIIPESVTERIREIVAQNKNEISETDFYLGAFVILMYRYTQTDAIRIPVIELSQYGIALKDIVMDIKNSMSFENIIQNLCSINKKQNSCHINKNEFCDWISLIKNTDTVFCFCNSINELHTISKKVSRGILVILYRKNTIYHLAIFFNNQKYPLYAIQNLSAHFCKILSFCLDNMQQDIRYVDIMENDEKKKLISDWNSTEKEFPLNFCLHQLFEEQVKKNPNKIAIYFENASSTYLELNSKANKIAHYLLYNGIKKSDVVAVYLIKSIDFVASILGVMKVGAAYLPIDASYPPARVEYMIKDSESKLIISESSIIKMITCPFGVPAILIDKTDDIINQPINDLNLDINPKDYCYMIYTSGSTGEPKGIILNHLGRVNNFLDSNQRFAMTSYDKLLSVSSASFDLSAYEILGTLLAGATIILPNDKLKMQPLHWIKLIEQYKITVWHSVPILAELLCQCAIIRTNASMKSLRIFIMGGDWIPKELPLKIRNICEDCKMFSFGGACEASMDSVLYPINEVDMNWSSIPYGKPMSNQKTYILDKNLQLLPVGIPGELCLGGIGVAEGYYNKAEMTSQKFLCDPWGKSSEDRIYKTGDLARYLPDGNIQLLGRLDYQVKINGVRIELGEIEAYLKKNPLIKEVVIVAVPEEKGSNKKRLIAYIIFQDKNNKMNYDEIRQYILKKMLPAYIPSKVISIEEFPITPNGKVDRNFLITMADEYSTLV